VLKATSVCPKCGGDAPDATPGETYTCKFCGATSRLEAPPAIVQQTVVQAEVIRRVVLVEPTTGKTSLPCPRCDVPLFEGKAAEATLHGCGSCGGVWLDNAASSRVVNAVQPGLTAMSDRAARAGKIAVDETKPAKCPLDGNALERVDVKGVEVDVCRTHGTWFDAGEVRRVGTAFQSERIALAGGATYDYRPAAEEALKNQRYAEGAMAILGAILTGVAGASTPRR
jgi:Zn-finger nucleic acid-binding protein